MDVFTYRGADGTRTAIAVAVQFILTVVLGLALGRILTAGGVLSAIFGAAWRDVPPVGPLVLVLLMASILILLYRGAVPRLVMRRYYDGIHRLQRADYEGGIRRLLEQLAHLDAAPNTDHLRAFTMMDGSLYGYTEMTLLNLAYAHYKLEQHEESLAYLERCLEEYPHNGMARAVQRIIATEM